MSCYLCLSEARIFWDLATWAANFSTVFAEDCFEKALDCYTGFETVGIMCLVDGVWLASSIWVDWFGSLLDWFGKGLGEARDIMIMVWEGLWANTGYRLRAEGVWVGLLLFTTKCWWLRLPAKLAFFIKAAPDPFFFNPVAAVNSSIENGLDVLGWKLYRKLEYLPPILGIDWRGCAALTADSPPSTPLSLLLTRIGVLKSDLFLFLSMVVVCDTVVILLI